jgi:hypothetical protein
VHQLLDRALLLHAAAGDHEDSVARELRLVEQVRGEQHGVAAGQLPHEAADLADLRGVEPHGRLVEDEHLRIVEEGRGEADPLPVALRELGDGPAADVLEPAVPQRRRDGPPAGGPVEPEEPGPVLQVLDHPHLGVERSRLGQVADLGPDPPRLPRHVQAVHGHRARRGRQVAGDHPDRRGLARAVGAEEGDDVARLDLEIERIDRHEMAESLGEALGDDHGWTL